MKKTLIAALLLIVVFFKGFGQISTTGVVVLDGTMSFRLDKNNATSTVALTLKGPSDRWFAIGFNSLIMDTNVDCVMMTGDTQLTDSHFPDALHHAPVADATDNWTLLTNTVTAGIRTITATRPFTTGDAFDFDFSTPTTSLDFVWAYSYNPIYDLYDPLNSGHGSDNYGAVTANFTTLGTVQNTTSYKVTAYPNPVTDVLHLSFSTSTAQKASVLLFNELYQVVYKQEVTTLTTECTIPTATLPNGVYYVAIKMDHFQSFKKIIIGK